MRAVDNLITLSHIRTARALANPTTAGEPWAERNGVRTDPFPPGLRQITEADILALRDPETARVRALRVAEGQLAALINAIV